MTTQSKHTPGPWTAHQVTIATYPSGQSEYKFCINNDEEEMHVCETIYGSNGNDEIAANARLIAAAPDLLAVLEAMVNAPTGTGMRYEREARAAIAKARGQS